MELKTASKLLSTPFSRPLSLHDIHIYVHIYISTHSIGPCYATRTRQLHCTIFTYAVTVTRRTHIPNEASPSDSRTPLIRLASKLSFDCIACFANRDDSPNRGGEDQAAGKMRINRPIPLVPAELHRDARSFLRCRATVHCRSRAQTHVRPHVDPYYC